MAAAEAKEAGRGELEAARPEASEARRVSKTLRPEEQHWVGDGFFVSTLFSPFQIDPQTISPFILLDHAAPKYFSPSLSRRGVGEHPHRGFETVTFAYSGEVSHRDSGGGGGTIGSGDVQWMTAGAGVVHEELHSQAFSERGGTFEMVQLWVNLPARLKLTQPRYQGLVGKTFPELKLGAATARLVAGSLGSLRGPAQTHTPITVFNLRFDADGESRFELPRDHTLLILGRSGSLSAGDATAGPSNLLVFERGGDGSGDVVLRGKAATEALVLSGEPLNEPVVAHGPFVMNTRTEIMTAIHDYQSGRMGRL